MVDRWLERVLQEDILGIFVYRVTIGLSEEILKINPIKCLVLCQISSIFDCEKQPISGIYYINTKVHSTAEVAFK